MRVLKIIAFLFLVSWTAWSAEESTADSTQTFYPNSEASEEADSPGKLNNIFPKEDRSMGMFVTVLGYLVVLGGLGVAAWYLFKRGLISKTFSKTDGKLQIAESRMLGNRQFIMVVEYEDNKILLGVGPGKIDYLTSLNTYRNDFPDLEGKNPQSLEERV